MKRIFFLILLGSTLLNGQDVYRLTLTPLDYRYEGPSFLDSLDQIETDGKHLFLRSVKNTEIMVITTGGKFVKNIGGQGEHPGEFGFAGVLAFSLHGNRLWALDMERKRARYFKDGVYRDSFKVDSFNVYFDATTSNRFAFSDKEVVIPCAPSRNHLAAVYGYDGTLEKHVGEMLPFTAELKEQVSGINDTFWLFHEGHWFSIHKYYPMVTRYDAHFEITDQFQVTSKIIEQGLDHIYRFFPKANFNTPQPIFSDVKIYGNALYLMSYGHLHQVDLKTRTVSSITSFRGEGQDFRHVTAPFITLYFFAILEGGKCVLAHPAMLWNHELWTATLPYLVTSQN